MQPLTPVRHIAIVIPAHNEQEHIDKCLTAIAQAIDSLQAYLANNGLFSIKVSTVVVLDSCRDDTQPIVEKIAEHHPNLHPLICDYQCVGQVRALGVRHAIAQGADWIACTDADSEACEDWLVAQVQQLHAEPCDMICGVVSVMYWGKLSQAVQEKYLAHYQDCMNHRHIHGANLCFSADAYVKVGGFAELPCHEDVDLVRKFETHHLTIIWSNLVRVITSSRLEARASEGFANFLVNLQQENATTP